MYADDNVDTSIDINMDLLGMNMQNIFLLDDFLLIICA